VHIVWLVQFCFVLTSNLTLIHVVFADTPIRTPTNTTITTTTTTISSLSTISLGHLFYLIYEYDWLYNLLAVSYTLFFNVKNSIIQLLQHESMVKAIPLQALRVPGG
jgi:hypothetical protein